MQAQDIKSMCVKDPAVAEFAKHTDAFMPRMVWTDSCRVRVLDHTCDQSLTLLHSQQSWYKANGTGRVTALWPGSAYNFITAIEDVRWEDCKFEVHTRAFPPDSWGPADDYTYVDSGSRS